MEKIMIIANWININFLRNPWISVVIAILLLLFAMDIMQLIISYFSFKLSKEEQDELMEIFGLKPGKKLGKLPELRTPGRQ
jgi:hypothetical protein